MAEPAPTPIIPPANDKPPKSVPKEDLPKDEAPPKMGPKGPGTTSTQSGKPTKFHRELAELMSLPALLFELKGDLYPAYVWNTRITKHAYAWADLAEKNPALKRYFQRMMEGGAYGAVILSGLAVLVPIMAFYGVYPQGMMNPFQLSPAEMAEFEAMRQGGSNHSQPFDFAVDDEGAIPYPTS